LKEKSN